MSNILLVEDDAMMREAFTIILNLRDEFTVAAAENGSAALDLCKQNTYDVILLDIMMPVMDGIEFLRQYRTLFPNAKSKIVIMSNLSSGSELSQAQDYGIERSVLKSSLTPALLMTIVDETLQSSHPIVKNFKSTDNDSSTPDDAFAADTP